MSDPVKVEVVNSKSTAKDHARKLVKGGQYSDAWHVKQKDGRFAVYAT